MYTKGAVGNLVNRYKAVLEKCNLLNVFGSLAVAAMLVMGCAGEAGAARFEPVSVDTITNETSIEGGVGIYYVLKREGSDTISNKTLTVEGTKKKIHRIYTAVNSENGDVTDSKIIIHGGNFLLYNPDEGVNDVSVICSSSVKRGNAYRNETIIDINNENSILTVDDAYGAIGDNVKDEKVNEIKENSITIKKNVNIRDVAIGGQMNGTGNVIKNKAIYEGNENSFIAYLMGGKILNGATGNAEENHVEIRSGDVKAGYGGVVDGTGNATKNEIMMTGGTASQIYGGYTANGCANDNKVIITCGRIDERTIENDFIEAVIVGGATDGGSPAEAKNNMVMISSLPDLRNASIYGGRGPDGADVRTGNTLSIKTIGLTAKNIYNFEKYDFQLPNTVKNGDCALTLTDSNGTHLGKDPKVTVAIEGGAPLEPGFRVYLIRNKVRLDFDGELIKESLPVTVRQGGLVDYTASVSYDDHSLYVEIPKPEPEQPEEPTNPEPPATAPDTSTNPETPVEPEKPDQPAEPELPVEPEQPVVPEEPETPEEPEQPVEPEPEPEPAPKPSGTLNPQAKSLSEGRIAMLAFVNQGAELIAERGMAAARHEAIEGSLTPFLAGQGGKSRYDTGSHVDVAGFSLMAGLTSAQKTEFGTATMAAFFESGWGNYDSHNSFATRASVDADGDTNYCGGGLLAHMAFSDFGPGHIYAEASLRAGWAETDYGTFDLHDDFGNRATYDSGSAYYGAHFGLGYEWKLSDASALDCYAKYFWTHQEGDHVTVMGGPIHFKSADSHRTRFGVRYEHTFHTGDVVLTPFAGAAYEYEYDGDVAGTAYGYAIDKPSLRGGTGIGELGVTLQSSENSALSLDLGIQCYTGTREGVTGSFMLNYRF